jgi:hypothetical protein
MNCELSPAEQDEASRDDRDRYIAWSGNPSTSTYAEVIASEQREHIQTEAYAAGRADEREEWKPVLEALRNLELGANTVAACYSRNPGNFAAALRDLSEYAETARAAIAKATGEA